METKPLIYGIIGFLLGGFIVSTVAVTIEKPRNNGMMSMASTLEGKSGDEFDKAFLSGMIVHHQDAVDMANLAKAHAKHDEIKKLADDIIAAQSNEIDMMQAWQADWGYKSAPANHNSH